MRVLPSLFALSLCSCKAHTTTSDTELAHPDRHPNYETVRGLRIYAPDPPARLLGFTKSAGRGTKGRCGVDFCVGIDGKPTKVKTGLPFPNDPEVDRICREAVEKWYFKPHLVDGVRTEICTSETFQIDFKTSSKSKR